MRLLLLLSALFAAFAGVAGTRVAAHPVQASAAVSTPVIAAETQAPVTIRPTGAAFGRVRPVRTPLTSFVAVAASRLLYADRRRE